MVCLWNSCLSLKFCFGKTRNINEREHGRGVFVCSGMGKSLLALCGSQVNGLRLLVIHTDVVNSSRNGKENHWSFGLFQTHFVCETNLSSSYWVPRVRKCEARECCKFVILLLAEAISIGLTNLIPREGKQSYSICSAKSGLAAFPYVIWTSPSIWLCYSFTFVLCVTLIDVPDIVSFGCAGIWKGFPISRVPYFGQYR